MTTMVRLLLGMLLAASVSPRGAAQTSAGPNLPAVPTTKVLAIGSVSDPAKMAAAGGAAQVMPHEVSDTVRLYLAGKIDQWYVRKDARGVVFLMNVSSVEEAHALLEKLPLGVAGVMQFQLIPLGPLSPLNYLLGAAPTAAKP